MIYICSALLMIILVFFLIMDMQGENKILTENEEQAEEEVSEISISIKSGFYENDIMLVLMTREKGQILYTMDGSTPQKGKEGTLLYKKPITLVAGEEETVTVFKYCIDFEDGTQSKIYTNTYFVGKNIEQRYNTLVISVSAEEDDLYGQERGIFVEGKLREDWLLEHPEEEVEYHTPANYNLRGRDSERDVYIEMFEDGKRIISQNGGIRISGNFTRQSEQKSFQLYARSEYDIQNKFRYAFFDDLHSSIDDSVIGKYKRLKVRNTGNDRSEGFIRDELGLTLAKEAGFLDTQSVRPVSVYINGVYQGLYWMHSTYEKEYFEQKYGNYDGEMVVIGDSEMNMITDSDDELTNKYAEEYTELYNKYSTLDLTEDSIFEELKNHIDIRNYLQYYGIEVYLANKDWPFNNLKAYRYVAAEEEYLENSVFDGRYRYLLYDVDTTMGLGSVRDTLEESQSYDTLVKIMENNYAPLFTALMEREDCRAYFASYLCDLANGAFSAENVRRVLEEMDSLRKNEMEKYIEESINNPDLPEISSVYLEMQMDCINAWAEVTPDNLINNIKELWQLGDTYDLHVYMDAGDGVFINSLEFKESEFTGIYFTGCNTILSAMVQEGREFSHWEINGTIWTKEKVIIDEKMLIDGSVTVSLYTKMSGNGLVLEEIREGEEGDYIALINISEQEVSTMGYFLMDKENTSHMNYLEATILEPGERIVVGCKNYNEEECFMNVNFNLKKGEEVILGHSNGGIYEKVIVPDLEMENGTYKKDMTTRIWQEERGE